MSVRRRAIAARVKRCAEQMRRNAAFDAYLNRLAALIAAKRARGETKFDEQELRALMSAEDK